MWSLNKNNKYENQCKTPCTSCKNSDKCSGLCLRHREIPCDECIHYNVCLQQRVADKLI